MEKIPGKRKNVLGGRRGCVFSAGWASQPTGLFANDCLRAGAGMTTRLWAIRH